MGKMWDERDTKALLSEVAVLARAGADVTAMLRAIQQHLGTRRCSIEAISLLRRVFDLPLYDLLSIGGWIGFESGNPGPDDAELELRFGAGLRSSIKPEFESD